ncbi:MAG: phosphatidic acid phosphatase, partial [Myxococcota bacterium]
AWAARRWVEPRIDPAAVRVELQCLVEMARFTLRHRRYGTIAVVLLAASIPAWRERRPLRAGYCFLQLVDDWLDGDRPCDEEPLDRVESLRDEIRSRAWSDRPASWLAAAVVADLAPADVDRLVALLATMAVDRRRRLARALWTADALDAHHRATFGGSVDLLLAGVRSRVRSDQLPDLLDAFGVVSTLRDLREDLASGLCNAPAEVVGSTPWDALDGTPAFEAWKGSQIARGRAALARAGAQLEQVDAPARRALAGFVSSMGARLDRAAAEGAR